MRSELPCATNTETPHDARNSLRSIFSSLMRLCRKSDTAHRIGLVNTFLGIV